MTATSDFATRALAAFGAFAITAALLVASFATGPQVSSVVGVLA
ncbi:conserved hypothetical protein [Altererythrobacter sp. B11]|nr:hypothetical protein [Altererythrobacter sp. B11]BBC74080.1 conserved hypothetical protein [Altererythrobacter sp. B11]